MNETYTFYENNRSEFLGYIESYLLDLQQNDINYNSLINNIERILDIYPNIRKVIDYKEEIELSKKEVTYLIEVLCLMEQQNDFEKEAIFFMGMKEAYCLFKKLNILKD